MKIKLNGKVIETKVNTLEELIKASVYVVNGFSEDENYILKEEDEIIALDKNRYFEKEELKHFIYARNGVGMYDKISKAKVAIAGVGGIGSFVAVSLARLGVANLTIVDFDKVEPTNLNRQSYFLEDLGEYKVEALKRQLEKINPFIEVKALIEKVTKDNIVDIFSNFDIVIEAFDKAENKAMLVNTLLEKDKKVKIVACSGMAGIDDANLIKTKKLTSRLYISGDFKSEAEQFNGLLSPRVFVTAGHMANTVLRLILNEE